MQFTENIKATEYWLDNFDNVLRRIDQHSTAVASKALFTDRISRYLKAEEDLNQTICDVAIKILSHSYEPALDIEDREVEAMGGAQYFQKLRYEAVLGDTLLSSGFAKSDPYIDPKGGLVVDYFRNSDRITLVFSDESVQLLTHVSGQFLDKYFSPAQTSQIEVRDFLDGLLLGTE